MSPKSGEILLELKAKWLAQSPNAPTGATRCRTCALRAKRTAASSSEAPTASDAQGVCPLDLGTSTAEVAVNKLTTNERIRHFLIKDAAKLFRDLRFHQSELDPHGILEIHGQLRGEDQEITRDLSKAMTIRDCTLFVRRSHFSTVCVTKADIAASGFSA